MTSDSDTDTWHCNAMWHCQCHVSHTRVTHRNLTRGIFYFYFQKILKK